jgi:hypothetical protein
MREHAMSDEDFGLALKERMDRAADDIAASPEMLGKVRERYVRRRRHRSWAMVVGALIAVAAVVIPTTLTGGGSATDSTQGSTGPAGYQEPDWARHCFERQEQEFGAQLKPAPEYVGSTMSQAWRHVTSQGPIKSGAVTAWNGKCVGWVGGDFGPPDRTLFIAVVGDVDPTTRGAPNADRVVAARIADPCPRHDPWNPCGRK